MAAGKPCIGLRPFRFAGWFLGPARADVKLPAIFGNHMVLQRDQKDRVWGWADPGEEVTVTINDQTKTTKAGPTAMAGDARPDCPPADRYTLTVNGKNTLTFGDVLVGEVWICSGQSNMQMSVGGSNDADLEIRAANYPGIRLITVPNRRHSGAAEGFQGQVGSLLAPDRRGFLGRGLFLRPPAPSDARTFPSA